MSADCCESFTRTDVRGRLFLEHHFGVDLIPDVDPESLFSFVNITDRTRYFLASVKS